MSSKSATKRPTLMQTGRNTTSLWRLERRGSRWSSWEEGGSHVKMTINAKQDDIQSCQISCKTGRHISQTRTICRGITAGVHQVDKPSARGINETDVERIKDHLQCQNVDKITWIPADKMLADQLTKLKADSTTLTTVLRTGVWKKPA